MSAISPQIEKRDVFNEAHPKVTLDKAPRLVVPDRRRIAGQPDGPFLKRNLDQPVVFLVGRGRGLREREGGHDRLRAGDAQSRDEVGKLGVGARETAVCVSAIIRPEFNLGCMMSERLGKENAQDEW
jgi:hypothetical protein